MSTDVTKITNENKKEDIDMSQVTRSSIFANVDEEKFHALCDFLNEEVADEYKQREGFRGHSLVAAIPVGSFIDVRVKEVTIINEKIGEYKKGGNFLMTRINLKVESINGIVMQSHVITFDGNNGMLGAIINAYNDLLEDAPEALRKEYRESVFKSREDFGANWLIKVINDTVETNTLFVTVGRKLEKNKKDGEFYPVLYVKPFGYKEEIVNRKEDHADEA